MPRLTQLSQSSRVTVPEVGRHSQTVRFREEFATKVPTEARLYEALRRLVVEDDSHVREVLVETLRFSDFEAVGYDEAEKLLHDLDQSTMVPQNGGFFCKSAP